MHRTKYLFLYSLVLLTLTACRVKLEPVEILTFKQELEKLFPTAVITKMEPTDHFSKAYHLILQQPLDHDNIEAGTFSQHVYLSHADTDLPTVLVTEGYDAKPSTYELSKIFKGNQVQVEYRFYGKSRPDPIPWEYLKNDQAIEDYHAIITKLRRLYDGKWISTGISKGGETVLIHKSIYPWDVDVAVPYVAPLIDTQEDPRTDAHINSIGSDQCRLKIKKFQRLVLENRDAVLEKFQTYAAKKNMKFTEVPFEEALEYAVLEFPFSFWQWGGRCDDIPVEGASTKALFEYIERIVGVKFYSDQTYFDLLPSYYQHMIELGYYGFDTSPVEDLLQVVKEPTNMRFAPKDVDMVYDEEYIKKVREYVENKGNKIIYIYGEYDTWGACAPNPKPHVDALKMVLKGASHSTRIRDFSKEEQEIIYNKLQKWLGYSVRIYPLENKIH